LLYIPDGLLQRKWLPFPIKSGPSGVGVQTNQELPQWVRTILYKGNTFPFSRITIISNIVTRFRSRQKIIDRPYETWSNLTHILPEFTSSFTLLRKTLTQLPCVHVTGAIGPDFLCMGSVGMTESEGNTLARNKFRKSEPSFIARWDTGST
jgi:hypothetical protein